MRNVTSHDAVPIEPEYSARCREHAKAVFAVKREMSEQVIALGRRLLVVRALLPRDAYRRWLRLHFAWRPSQAAYFIRAARRFDREGFDKIDPWALLLLGSKRSSAKLAARAVELSEDGCCVTADVAHLLMEAEAGATTERQCG
jgi:hypothetical protein